MIMAKQNFGLPYLQRLMARGAGQQAAEEVRTDCLRLRRHLSQSRAQGLHRPSQAKSSNEFMQGTLRWGHGGVTGGRVELSEELMFAVRLGRYASFPSIPHQHAQVPLRPI
jgi:hypothetical protein